MEAEEKTHDMVTITLPGKPLSTQHLYGRRGKRTFMKPEGVAKKEEYQWEAKRQFRGREMYTEKIEIFVYLYFPDFRIRDVDNYHKISLDALNGIVWSDDHKIYRKTTEKFHGCETPQIVISIKKYE